MKLDKNTENLYEEWKVKSSGWVKAELEEISLLGEEERSAEINERFSVSADFGTGGLRGKIRAGLNGINDNWIIRISSAISEYSDSVVIAYDTRRKSREFALTAARVFVKRGLKTYLFSKPAPTPVLSFAVKHLKCDSGVVITASHNPPEYNGYKVYDSRGVQLVPDKVDLLKGFLENESFFENVDETNDDQINYVYDDLKRNYFEAVLEELGEVNGSIGLKDDLKILYTPLHGTGADFIPDLLGIMGVECATEETQMIPDTEFSTVKVPNPENVDVFGLSREKALAMENRPSAIIATDPDADRLGVLVFNGDDYVPLNGNEIGILLLDFLCRNTCAAPARCVLKTIVTTDMAFPISADYDCEVYETLTGFKFLGNLSDELFKNGKTVLFSFEESYGYLYGNHCGDKDAVSTTALLMYLLSESETGLPERLMNLRRKFGYYVEDLMSFSFDGIKGQSVIRSIMHAVREGELYTAMDKNPVGMEDYLERSGHMNSDVLKMEFEGGLKLVFRPSGTEPKIKVYISVKGSGLEEANNIIDSVKMEIDTFVRGLANGND